VKTVGILVFPDVEELDFVGPYEVFGLTGRHLTELGSPDGVSVITASPTGDTVDCAHGLRVLPDFGFDRVPKLDVLVVPGGRGAREQKSDPRMLEFVLDQSRKCELVTSVCTGALILAAAGLLDGKRATTHWAALDELRQFEKVEVERKRYIHDGKIITSAGISAGIDAALHVVRLLFGEEIRVAVAKRLEHFILSD
jgi:transcriptional regulator GlxA family with amidase domain